MEPNYFKDKFGKPSVDLWQVRECLSNYNVEGTYGRIEFDCVFDTNHPQATIYRNQMDYICGVCSSSDNQSTLNARFEQWLAQKNMSEPEECRHINPLDAHGDGAELVYWPDIEGNPLLYRGFVHFVYGKPETLKSWFALRLLKEADVRVWDFENGVIGTKNRLLSLGIQHSQANGYASPQDKNEILARVSHYEKSAPDILVIDGFSGFAQVMGINPDSNNEVMTAFGEVFVPLKKAGVTVVIIDHLPKDSMTFDYPIGAQAKKSQADVAFFFKATADANKVEIFVSKDRHGLLNARSDAGAGQRKLGSLHLISTGKTMEISVRPTYSVELDGQEIKEVDAELMTSIHDYVAAHPNSSKTAIETALEGKNQRIRNCISLMVDSGSLVVKFGSGGSHLLSIGNPLDLEWKPLTRGGHS